MDWYPLLNSLRIAAISAVVVFFTGIAAAYYIAKLRGCDIDKPKNLAKSVTVE